ncbi:hypothetical protein [Williamwhitmania taraxaci]|uniref:Uncharacterized protein n=1 Tax=Williamwhitmania taraxaci TaxID=1640674 RepID=A0A1G6MDR9_9BACT|nr:hypothetical protein [Williamwhitmania taraxaci]SDC53630.1 hypothetical protein SAMN05216323_103549 [Williamwhitmania taraxaci]
MDPIKVTVTFEQEGKMATVTINQVGDVAEITMNSTPTLTDSSDYARLAYLFIDFIKKL